MDRKLALVEEACFHQCRRCGVVYCCGEIKCGNPFDSGYCNVCSPTTIEAPSYVALAA